MPTSVCLHTKVMKSEEAKDLSGHRDRTGPGFEGSSGGFQVRGLTGAALHQDSVLVHSEPIT